MNEDRSPFDGRPYYCIDCGCGYGEFLACELPNCRLENPTRAQKRKQNHRRREAYKRLRLKRKEGLTG